MPHTTSSSSKVFQWSIILFSHGLTHNLIMETPWKQLVLQEPVQLHPTIAYIHHAAQLVAAVGNSLLPKADDDSQSNLEWRPSINTLVGNLVDGEFRAALRYVPFEIMVLDDQNRIREGITIPHKTKDELMLWLQRAVTRLGGKGEAIQAIDHFEIPEHPVGKGEPFPEIELAMHTELMHYRTNSDWILNEVVGLYKDASTVRTWPHHFDAGALISLERDDAGAATKTLGIGWAIPDEQFDEPYFYVNHWTKDGKPDYKNLPELEGYGEWYLDTWKGAILKASKVILHKEAGDQQQQTLQFFRAAIRATRDLL